LLSRSPGKQAVRQGLNSELSMSTFEMRNTRMPLEKMQHFQASLRSLGCHATISAAHIEFVNGIVDLRHARVNYDETRASEISIEHTANRHGLIRRQSSPSATVPAVSSSEDDSSVSLAEVVTAPRYNRPTLSVW
jgi:hypothetical protein